MSSKNRLDVGKILRRLKTAYGFSTDAQVADFLGIGHSTPSAWKNRNSADLTRILTRCKDVNYNWLLLGAGPVWREDARVEDEVQGTPASDTGQRAEVERLKAKIEALEEVIAGMDRRRQRWSAEVSAPGEMGFPQTAKEPVKR